MIDKMSSQQRVMLAMVLAFLFFIIYDYYFIPKQQPSSENITKVEQTVDGANPAPATNQQGITPNQVTANVVQNTPEVIAKVFAKEYELYIDKFGRIIKYYLNGENYKDIDGERIQLLDASYNLLPLEIRFADININNDAFTKPYTSSKSEVRLNGNGEESLILTQELSSITVTKKLTFTQDKGYRVKIELSSPYSYFITPGFRPNIISDSYTFRGAVIQKSDDSLEKIEDGKLKKSEEFDNSNFVSVSDRYYTTLFANFDKGLNVLASPEKNNDPYIFIKSAGENLNLVGYIGPKSRDNLHNVDERLDPVIEYGFFTIISKPLFSFLYFIHSKVGNWGWGIVVMTLLIRLVLYPVTYRGMVSMNKLKELAPKVKELQAQYKDDKQKLQVKMMELYKKHGANPMGGCLPILMQIPIFFAIYRVLFNAVELKNASWIFWIEDLSMKDPYFVLPILMGATMFLQQRLTPTTFTDPMQEKIMRLLPIIFTFFFLFFPAGLTLYWFVNNLFSIAQQLYVNRIFARKKIESELAKKEKQDDS